MSNDETAFRFFVAKGLTAEQAAGVVGNLLAESGCNPAASGQEAGGYYAHGIAQWGPPRWSALQAWASSRGLDPNALETQCGYVWQELQSMPSLGLAELRAASTVDDASRAFETKYERPAAGSSDRRIALSRGVLAKYGGAAADETPWILLAVALVVGGGIVWWKGKRRR